MQKPIGRKEFIIREYFMEYYNNNIPNITVQKLYDKFLEHMPDEQLSYGLFNGVLKKIKSEDGVVITNVAAPTIELDTAETKEIEIINIGDLNFPKFRNYKTGSLIDKLFSDHGEDGGLYSGTANIVVSESSVGKTTLMLNILAKIKLMQPSTKILYISSEMTRNDLYFYYTKMPMIASVPTLLLMDYMDGRFDLILEQALKGDYDVILIDSFQDIVVKMTGVLGIRAKDANGWLTNLIIEAADANSKAIFAIQHLTKGGTYVGSTYLKHATTSMLEIRFDSNKNRYIEFTKNRRGGSTANRRLYFNLVDGDIVWNEEAWNRENNSNELLENEEQQRNELSNRFNELFLSVVEDVNIVED